MKKKILIVTVITLICTTIGVFAVNALNLSDIGKISDSKILTESAKSVSVKEQIKSSDFDTLAEYIGYDTYEQFELLHRLLVFMGKYCTEKEQYAQVRDMVLDGCDVKTVMDIYQFYMTTNENISLVRNIYDLVWDGEEIVNRDVVFENAFNYLTGNKCGVLTEEDIEEYLEKGLSAEDIQHANLLSRKGVMTINDILDAIVRGKGWDYIVEKVSGENISSKYSSADGGALLNAMYVAETAGIAINDAIGNGGEDYFYDVTQSVNSAMKAKGYWKAAVSENTAQIIAEAAQKGISAETVMELLDSGYNECDMINAIKNTNCNQNTIASVISEEAAE